MFLLLDLLVNVMLWCAVMFSSEDARFTAESCDAKAIDRPMAHYWIVCQMLCAARQIRC
jgi:hypothetical protein